MDDGWMGDGWMGDGWVMDGWMDGHQLKTPLNDKTEI